MALSSLRLFDAKKAPSEVLSDEKEVIVVVLDLDESLVVLVRKIDSNHDILKELNYIECGSNGNYLVLPGALALLRYLFAKEKPPIRVCFFSLGPSERNKDLIKQLLILALGEEHYQLIKDKVAIFSRDAGEIHHEKYKKNLETVLKGESLENVIIIDDEEKAFFPSQLKNVLAVSKVTWKEIGRAFDKNQSCNANILESVNHLFYATWLLEKVFSTYPSCSVTQKLFEIQYEKEVVPFFSLKTGLCLVSFLDENFDLPMLQKMFDDLNMPLLIKVADKLFIFSKPDGENLKLNHLDSLSLTPIAQFFPQPNKKGVVIDGTNAYFYNIEKCFARLIDEIHKWKYHTSFTDILNDELSKDKSSYISGFKTLQEYDSELAFFGTGADKYFGLQKEEQSFSIMSSIKLKYMLWGCSLPQSLPKVNALKNNLNQTKKVTL